MTARIGRTARAVPKRRRLYTVGHSTRTFDELVAALQAWDVSMLIDIRQFTRSRANPQFNAASLRRRLPRRNLDYLVMPDLGGRRGRAKDIDPERNAGWTNAAFKNYADHAESPGFQRALTSLLSRANRQTCAIMCAEAVWWRCHRRIVADYAISKRVPVFHIFTPDKAVRATRTPFARLDRRTGTLRYPRASSTASRPNGRRSSRTRAGG
jgi:uncharacterized protein (DUF488 family)